jgi:hypothetical protein
METGEGTAGRPHCYDPGSRVMKEPQPIYESLLPDFHLSWGRGTRTVHTEPKDPEEQTALCATQQAGFQFFDYGVDQQSFQVRMDEARQSPSPVT